jgi:hypothetical protein
MISLRSHEGEVLIDHRNSPGVPDQIMLATGYPVGAGHGKFESATFTCPYCETVVVMNPDRSRPRNYDRKTNHLICDGCEALRVSGVEMKTMKQIADELLNQAAKVPVTSEAFQSPTIIIP